MYVNVSLHDVAPGTEPETEYLLAFARRLGFPRGTLLVTPDFHGQGFLTPGGNLARRLTALAEEGWEIALHGLTHCESFPARPAGRKFSPLQFVISRWYTDREGEFYRLSAAEASARIEKGLAILAACRLEPAGFVAPAWLLSKESLAALGEFNFLFTTTLTGLYDLRRRLFYPAPALVFSSRSVPRAFFSRLAVPALAGVWRRRELLRLALHPADARHPAVLRTIAGLAQKILAGRRPVTLAAYLREKEGMRCGSAT
ncbi:MAG: DUF2334 domain-containing protein [Moorella sp. (in: Bacteria)]|nr:DUF2334 domain-containing protein [Moorella sp. (in: firmicutes)]